MTDSSRDAHHAAAAIRTGQWDDHMDMIIKAVVERTEMPAYRRWVMERRIEQIERVRADG